MASLYVQFDQNSAEARRQWIRRYGANNTPNAKTFKRIATERLLNPNSSVLGFENQNVYADRPKRVITNQLMTAAMVLIRQSYAQPPTQPGPTCRRNTLGVTKSTWQRMIKESLAIYQ